MSKFGLGLVLLVAIVSPSWAADSDLTQAQKDSINKSCGAMQKACESTCNFSNTVLHDCHGKCDMAHADCIVAGPSHGNATHKGPQKVNAGGIKGTSSPSSTGQASGANKH